MGHAFARPEVRTVAVLGEGSAQYSLHALWTAAQHNLPVTFVIPNNSGYLSLKYDLDEGSQKAWQAGWDLGAASTWSASRGFGCAAERVETPEALAAALRIRVHHTRSGTARHRRRGSRSVRTVTRLPQ